MSKAINLCRPTSAPPPTEYGLIYTPNDPNLAPKVAFYRINPDDSSKLQYTLDWGQSYVDNDDYIEWTLDDLIGITSSQQQLESIIARTISPRVPSLTDGEIVRVTWDEFEFGTIGIWPESPRWSLPARGYGDSYYITIKDITIRGGCDIRAIGTNTTISQITVTKYVG